jgi:hypothetical protein
MRAMGPGRLAAGLAAFVLFGAIGCKQDDQRAPMQPAREPNPTAGHGFVMHDLKPADGALPVLLSGELAKAKAQKLKPIVYIGATWCAPCVAIQKNLADPLMIDAFQGTYVIHLDLDAWDKALTAAGFKNDAVPVFFRVDEAGKPQGKIDGGAWEADIPANMAPPLKAFFRG